MVDIRCPFCHSNFVLGDTDPKTRVDFCPSCGNPLKPLPPGLVETVLEDIHHTDATLVQGHAPLGEGIQFTVGPYQILGLIGKGGMGEVYSAYDTNCGRRIALKRIREDLSAHKQMHNRFLKEARITSQLTHPAIIPIYSIHSDNHLTYYTMPLVKGETLKQTLREARKLEKKGEKSHPVGGSISTLMRIFLTICQAIAYAHNKGVLHRDLKPENVILGTFGEVMILDWGLAKLMRGDIAQNDEPVIRESKKRSLHHLTRIGKVVGTVSYMAPERALGNPATIQTDIYSLGVILYQFLTLHFPFRRGTLVEFRKNLRKEEIIDPAEVAPYREVPRFLSTMCQKCMAKDPTQRYENMAGLIHDVENYLEGRSEWFEVAELNVDTKEDWEFQENVLIAEHIAITRAPEVTEWVCLMVSQKSFSENSKIEAQVRLGDKGQGIGFLLSVPEEAERLHLNDGYCLWVGSDQVHGTKLLRSTMEVLHAPEVFIRRHEWYRVRIEKVENNIHFYLNDLLQFSYISHLPLLGTHIGLLTRDADYVISPIKVYSGSLSINISCLAVPNAFLAHKDYVTALSEYRRIGYSFPERAEGREALFRAGITLLEQSRSFSNKEKSLEYCDLALEEFGELHKTPGAPLEYLGKALVYQSLRDYDEEIKCFELAYRRYPHNPLLRVLNDQIIYRMNESSRSNRYATYNFILLAIRYIPHITTNNNVRKLFVNLKKHWEELHFIEEDPDCANNKDLKNSAFCIVLSFWVAKTYTLLEVIDHLTQEGMSAPLEGVTTLANALFCLIKLGDHGLAEAKILELQNGEMLSEENLKRCEYDFKLLTLAISAAEATDKDISGSFEELCALIPNKLTKKETRVLFYLIRRAIIQKQYAYIRSIIERLKDYEIPPDAAIRVDFYLIVAYMYEKNWLQAGEVFQRYPLQLLNQETTPLHFLYGSWLYMAEGKEIANIHFSGVLDVSYPRTWTLGTHALNGKISETSSWFEKAFFWEKRQLFRQLAFFYACIGDEESANRYLQLERTKDEDLNDEKKTK